MRPARAPGPGICSWLSFHAQQLEGVVEVDLAFVVLGQSELLYRADALPDEHRPAFGIERAVAREHHAVGAEERDAAGERRRGAAEHGVAVEHLEELDGRSSQLFQDLRFVFIGATRAEL